MNRVTLYGLITCCLFSLSSSADASSPSDHPLFSGDAVHEIHITFHQPAWWDSLVHNFEDFNEPRYLAAEFDWEAVHFDSIGIRFKGQSSYRSYPTDKKPFKLDFNEFVSGQSIEGLDKLNLSNGFKDPSFVREKCAFELCDAAGLPTQRTNYAALYLNGTYWGLYTLVEQFDQEFIESRFGADERGNLWKGDNHGSLEYLGPNQESYYSQYELKTNEEENDWSVLIEVTDVLNNTPLVDLPDTIGELLDVYTATALLAVDNLTVNLDSYAGRCCNYYLYHRDSDGRFVFSNWDLNEAWGCFTAGLSVNELKQLNPFWTMEGPGQQRPLAQRLWQVDAYRELYLGHIRAMMAGYAHPDTLIERMVDIRDLIRPYVYADSKKMYNNDDFEAAMWNDIGGGPGGASPGLEPFIRDRDAWLRSEIGEWNPIEGIVLNEIMASNEATQADEHGEFDDWIEITNTGTDPMELAGLSLTDDLADPIAYEFPDMTLMPGAYLVIWADGQPEQGELHANFGISASGETLYLLDSGVIVDETSMGPIGSDISWGRIPDGIGAWKILAEPTPGAENQDIYEPEEIVLFINEFLALNQGVNQDEAGEYGDWVEIYNPGPEAVALGGLFLTDDMESSTQWIFPDSSLQPGEFIVVWCDGDEDDGPFHANFSLNGDGEEIGLFGRLTAGNNMIDGYTFGAQSTDISEGRDPDGGETWVFYSPCTPGVSNSGGVGGETAPMSAFTLLEPYPNPFSEAINLRFEVPEVAHVRFEIYDLCGRRVSLLTDQQYAPGEYRLSWNGIETDGTETVSGTYIARLTSGKYEKQRRIVFLR